jgi:hypothetical protein
VVARQDRRPGPVAGVGSPLGGSDEIREQHGEEATIAACP